MIPSAKSSRWKTRWSINSRGSTRSRSTKSPGLTFARGLRSILRHDPDVILIGEIRDQETAQIAVQASLTGHLVFSTLAHELCAGRVDVTGDKGGTASRRLIARGGAGATAGASFVPALQTAGTNPPTAATIQNKTGHRGWTGRCSRPSVAASAAIRDFLAGTPSSSGWTRTRKSAS